MRINFQICCAILLVLVNLAVGICLAFFVWLYCDWMVDDSEAAHFSSTDWNSVALERLIVGLMTALVSGAIFATINRFAFVRLFPERNPTGWMMAGFIGWIIAAGAIAGSIQFVMQKPFM